MKGAASAIIASKLLARKQKQQTQLPLPKEQEPDSDQENGDEDEFNEATPVAFAQSKPYSSIRSSILGQPALPVSMNIATVDNNRQPQQRATVAPPRGSVATRGTLSAPRSTLSQAASRSTLLALQSQTGSGGEGGGAFSQSHTEDLMAQYALAEKNKHLKRMKDDNDKLAALLKV